MARKPVGKRGNGRYRLIAGLRISGKDEALLAVARPFFPEALSEGELAYRLWRRGLELTLAEAAAIGVPLPPDTSEELIAGLIAQRLLLCLPLLRRVGLVQLLGLQTNSLPSPETAALRASEVIQHEEIDPRAASAVTNLGSTAFL